MSFLGNVFNFEQFKLGNMWDKVKKNPEQLLLGAGDPFSAGVWSKVTGKKYEPLVDQWGGATPDDYSKAEAKGIDTSDGRTMHGAARVIAGTAGASTAATGAAAGGAATQGGLLSTFSQYAGPASQALNIAGQTKAMTQGQPMQAAPAQFQQGQGFAGLLNPTDQVDMEKRRQAQQMAVQGLLGGYRG